MNAYSNKKGTFMEFENISLKEGIRLSRDKENFDGCQRKRPL